MGETGPSSPSQGSSEEVLDSLPVLQWDESELRFWQGRRADGAGGDGGCLRARAEKTPPDAAADHRNAADALSPDEIIYRG